MKLNGKEYKIPEIKKFSDIVKYEAKGIKLMPLITMSFYDPENLASSLIKGLSYLTGLTFEQALEEFDTYLENGGTLDEFTSSLNKDIEEMSKLGSVEGFSKGQSKGKKATKTETKQ